MNNKKTWFFSFLFALSWAGVFVALYWCCYFFPRFFDAITRAFGGSGVLAPPGVAMWQVPKILIVGTPFVRLFLFLIGEDEEGGDGDE